MPDLSRRAARLVSLAATAIAFLLLSPARSAAHAGDHSFFTIAYEAHMKRQLQGTTITLSAAPAYAREMASLFGVLKNDRGYTLLPEGTLCDSVDVTSTAVVARFTLPANMQSGELTDMDHETVAAILVRHIAIPLGIGEVRVLARRAPVAGRTAADYAGMETFTPPPPPLPVSATPDEPPPVPGPSYPQLYKTLSAPQPVGVTPRVIGQGPVATSAQPAGILSGRTVFFSGGHGWTANDSENGGNGSWFTQRGFLLSMCEDYGNIDQANFFAEQLFNAGATVVCMRPLGYQTNEVVLDNTSADVTFSPPASWTLGATSTDNYGDATGNNMRYTSTAATETATATYTPNIPAAGFYPVYCFANASSNRTSGQLYRILHSGGEMQVRVNHRRVGRGWIWLGNYYFAAGRNAATGSVIVSNLAPPGGTAGLVIADAIRFGNGMGDTARGAGVSGYPREAECSRYWLLKSEAPASVYNSSSTDQNDNVSAPSRMAAYMRDEDGQGYNGDIYLGFHSNASGGTARGSVGLITNATTVTNQAVLAKLVSDVLDTEANIEDTTWEYAWGNYSLSTITSSYGEIGPGLNGEMCGTIIEVAFHDNTSDAALLRDPKVRYVAARSQLHAIIKYFAQFDGLTQTYPPETPARVRAVNNGSGAVTVGWAPVAAGAVGTAAATGDRVTRSTDGLNYGNAITVNGNATVSTTISGLSPGQLAYFRVSAIAAGGESSPSETVAVRVTASGTPPVIIVNGYDRIDRFNNVPDFPGNAAGQEVERLRLRRNNSYDYVRLYGSAVAQAGRWFDSCSNEAVISGDVALANYQTVIWACGEESAADKTLDASERSLLQTYLGLPGKNLFISGAEIGNELVLGAVAPTFYSSFLQAGVAANSAGVYQAAGEAGSVLAGITADFTPGTDVYNVDSPDVLTAANGSTAAMSYVGAAGGATNLDAFDAIGGWKDPNFAGQTNADAASTFQIVASPVRQGTGSGELFYVWGASGTTIREYNSAQPSFPTSAPFSVWVYGDSSGHQLSILLRDPTEPEIFQNTPLTINFTGWRQITWNLATDPKTRYFGTGDNAFTGATAIFDSFLLTKVTATTSSRIYFDEATYNTGSGPVSPGTAAVQYSGTYKLLNFGFPFETIGSEAARNQVMNSALGFFATPLPAAVSLWQLY